MEYRGYEREVTRRANPREAASTRELLDEMVTQGQRLFREELRLAKAEVRDEAKKAGLGAGLAGAGGVVALVGAIVFAFALVWVLALALPVWGAAFIVAGILLLVAGGLALLGRRELKRATPVAGETRGTLEEDTRWARGTMRDVRSRMRANA